MYAPKKIPSPNTWLWHPHVWEGVGVKGVNVEVTIGFEVPVEGVEVGTGSGVLSPHGVPDSAVIE